MAVLRESSKPAGAPTNGRVLLSMNQISFVHAKSIASASHARVGKPYRRTAIGSSRNQKLSATKAILSLGKHWVAE